MIHSCFIFVILNRTSIVLDMYKKTPKEQQLGLFSAPADFLTGKAKSFYEDKDSWHNSFRRQVTMRIDEDIFSKLFSASMGAPNSSIRVLIAMMILKESSGWSDNQLFEGCRYNKLIRGALGFVNEDDVVPTESTYYLLRKRVVEYEKETGQNLMEEAFADITKGQATDFEVSGKSIRMDSKLMGSNIAWYSRYEIVHESLRLFYKELIKTSSSSNSILNKDITEELTSVLKEEGSKVVYRSCREEIKTKIHKLGILIDKILGLVPMPEVQQYQTLCRVFHDQFRLDENKLLITRPREEITSSSVQNPHDTDCHYRDKDGNKIKGYSINVTESCDKEGLNLISHVDVQPVSVPDNSFLKQSVEQSKEILNDKIENIHADGAYHSGENQQYCQEEGVNFYLNAMPGSGGQYDLSMDEDGELIVTDTITQEIIPVTKLENKWRINPSKGKYRYFTQKQIDSCSLRKEIESIPREILNVRNNVEATLFQLGYHYPNDKSRYRGIMKHRIWANLRCLWVNFARILKYTKQECQRTTGLAKSTHKSFVFELKSTLKMFIPFFLIKKQILLLKA